MHKLGNLHTGPPHMVSDVMRVNTFSNHVIGNDNLGAGGAHIALA